MSAYPLVLDGSRLEALIVGGGAVAARKARGLLGAGASVRVVAPVIGDELRALVASGARLTLLERRYARGDIGDALLVVAATNDRATNDAVARDAMRSRRLVNVVDAPDEGNCATPAVHRAGPLTIAVTTGGVPGAAARIRDALAARFDARYAAALDALTAARERLLRERDRDAWRRAAEELTGADFCEIVESGALAERVSRWR